MYRQSFARLYSSFGQQRKLFLLVFLWTCLCLVIFKSSLFGDNLSADTSGSNQQTTSFTYLDSNPNNPFRLGGDYSAAGLHYQSLPSASSSSAPSSSPALHASLASSNQQLKPAAGKQQDEAPVGSHCNYQFPELPDIQFNNLHWQKMTSHFANNTVNATYYLYNAYYDDRWRAKRPSVRILAMIDKIQPPATNCLLWSEELRSASDQDRLVPLVSQASFVYAWYPTWGNYKDGILQPWIVTCPVPVSHWGLVPSSVSLVQQPFEAAPRPAAEASLERVVRQAAAPAPVASAQTHAIQRRESASSARSLQQLDCGPTELITNNLPVYNRRPKVKGKFAVCVKGLDFPHEDLSIRLVEWIELLNLLGAGKIFLYNLDVHANISKVLHYYEQRGIVELNPLTLPGDQPNLPELQHQYLKSKLTAKRQNELIPYNDCLYRNLNSYQYLALLDIDEIIMPLKHRNWYDLMEEVETESLGQQNYTRASYNVRNVYFFDDLVGPMGTTSSSSSSSSSTSVNSAAGSAGGARQVQEEDTGAEMEHGIPRYLHMMQHVYRSRNYTKPGQYVKCFHNTERVVSLHNHFPINCFGQCITYSVPVSLAHLQHYRKDCVGPLKQSCNSDFRLYTQRDTTIWKYKQQMIRRTTRVLSHLGLLDWSAPR